MLEKPGNGNGQQRERRSALARRGPVAFRDNPHQDPRPAVPGRFFVWGVMDREHGYGEGDGSTVVRIRADCAVAVPARPTRLEAEPGSSHRVCPSMPQISRGSARETAPRGRDPRPAPGKARSPPPALPEHRLEDAFALVCCTPAVIVDGEHDFASAALDTEHHATTAIVTGVPTRCRMRSATSASTPTSTPSADVAKSSSTPAPASSPQAAAASSSTACESALPRASPVCWCAATSVSIVRVMVWACPTGL